MLTSGVCARRALCRLASPLPSQPDAVYALLPQPFVLLLPTGQIIFHGADGRSLRLLVLRVSRFLLATDDHHVSRRGQAAAVLHHRGAPLQPVTGRRLRRRRSGVDQLSARAHPQQGERSRAILPHFRALHDGRRCRISSRRRRTSTCRGTSSSARRRSAWWRMASRPPAVLSPLPRSGSRGRSWAILPSPG